MGKPLLVLVWFGKEEEMTTYVSYLKLLIKIRIYLEVPCYLKPAKQQLAKQGPSGPEASASPGPLLEIQTQAPLRSYLTKSSGGEAWQSVF